MNADSNELIKENIFSFLETIKGIKNAKSLFEIKLKQVNDITNDIYEIKIYKKTTLELFDKLIYKNFSKISETLNNNLEFPILETQKNSTSKILFIDPKNSYRIEECISNSKRIKRKYQFQSDIIEQIIQILISYSFVASIFTFTLKCDDHLNSKFKILINALNKEVENDKDKYIKNNFFDMCFKDLYERSLNTFKQFGLKFKARCIKSTNKTIFEEFQKLEFFMNNFKQLFNAAFPKSGYMIMNHNDFSQRKIILKNEKNINIIQNDFSCHNIIGFDFANYLNESVFNYLPTYQFNENDLDLDLTYKLYLKFIEKFEEMYSELKNNDKGKEILNEIKSRKYYLNLHCLINVFWVLHCSLYLNFEKFIENEGFDYFQHAIDRITLYEKISEKIESEDEENENDDEDNFSIDNNEELENMSIEE
jgi:hypothetical protein